MIDESMQITIDTVRDVIFGYIAGKYGCYISEENNEDVLETIVNEMSINMDAEEFFALVDDYINDFEEVRESHCADIYIMNGDAFDEDEE